MTPKPRRNRLLPLYNGIAVIMAAVAYTGYRMVHVGCAAPAGWPMLFLTVIPIVNLTLMDLTFVTQE